MTLRVFRKIQSQSSPRKFEDMSEINSDRLQWYVTTRECQFMSKDIPLKCHN